MPTSTKDFGSRKANVVSLENVQRHEWCLRLQAVDSLSLSRTRVTKGVYFNITVVFAIQRLGDVQVGCVFQLSMHYSLSSIAHPCLLSYHKHDDGLLTWNVKRTVICKERLLDNCPNTAFNGLRKGPTGSRNQWFGWAFKSSESIMENVAW